MTELATAPETVADTPSPAPAEARIAEKDINALADKVSEAAKPKSESEIAEKKRQTSSRYSRKPSAEPLTKLAAIVTTAESLQGQKTRIPRMPPRR